MKSEGKIELRRKPVALDAIKEAGISLNDIDAVAVGKLRTGE